MLAAIQSAQIMRSVSWILSETNDTTDHKEFFFYVTLKSVRLWLGEVELMAGRSPWVHYVCHYHKIREGASRIR